METPVTLFVLFCSVLGYSFYFILFILFYFFYCISFDFIDSQNGCRRSTDSTPVNNLWAWQQGLRSGFWRRCKHAAHAFSASKRNAYFIWEQIIDSDWHPMGRAFYASMMTWKKTSQLELTYKWLNMSEPFDLALGVFMYSRFQVGDLHFDQVWRPLQKKR